MHVFWGMKKLVQLKFVQLLLLNGLKAIWSKNLAAQGFYYINSFSSNIFGPYSKKCTCKVRVCRTAWRQYRSRKMDALCNFTHPRTNSGNFCETCSAFGGGWKIKVFWAGHFDFFFSKFFFLLHSYLNQSQINGVVWLWWLPRFPAENNSCQLIRPPL